MVDFNEPVYGVSTHAIDQWITTRGNENCPDRFTASREIKKACREGITYLEWKRFKYIKYKDSFIPCALSDRNDGSYVVITILSWGMLMDEMTEKYLKQD